jgi:hypothetical protein
VPRPVACGTDRAVAYVIFNTQRIVILPVGKILVWRLNWDPFPQCPKYFLPQLVCVHSVDSQYQPLFDTQFPLHKFADQHKGRLCNLVLSIYGTFPHITSLPLQNFPCIHLAQVHVHVFNRHALLLFQNRLRHFGLCHKTNCVNISIQYSFVSGEIKNCKCIICKHSFIHHTD